MSHDALFQLGMGAVLLNASQKEETFAMCASAASIKVISPASRLSRQSPAAAAILRTEKKSRSNSAKALIPRASTASASAMP
ncbi:hypothetical protein [Bosea sp. WAO]|uniref:hypothetical protein n=1 Tax=Bosea sp. WAO TaxID=406341 RepID=UPI001617515C|nr:hypothetical protein [Bosea sp. WAO]